MKKSIIFASMAALALVGCAKVENPEGPQARQEMSFTPMNETKGYSEGTAFTATLNHTLHGGDKAVVSRLMQISAYLYPQNGEEGNYFVGNTYGRSKSDDMWHNLSYASPDFTKNIVEPIYWPVGGTMDFLAYSFSEEKNIDVVWNEANAASQVVMDIPGENTQNDILFASKAGEKSRNTGSPVAMTFNHAQAWLEFQLTGTEVGGKGVVNFKRIELENVYNAGVLTIDNNKGNATAKWDFSAESKKNIEVDDNYDAAGYLDSTEPAFLDMLLPQQKKTAFVIYYTLGNDDQELSYRFTTDLKTWLMGEKYIYKINITTSEVTVAPTVVKWVDKYDAGTADTFQTIE